jgi:Bestrophin, RFP-TM, chloride channel
MFERIASYCNQYASTIPVAFALGFYTEHMVSRWWDQYITIPWPDRLAYLVSAFVKGADQRARLYRRTIMRYANLAIVLVLTAISPRAQKRFPTIDYLVKAGECYNWYLVTALVYIIDYAAVLQSLTAILCDS